MADFEDSDPEVFEIEDFTTASEWERFIAKLEEIIRSWHVMDSGQKTRHLAPQVDEPEWLLESKKLLFADFDFTLSYHKLLSNDFENKKQSSNPESCDAHSATTFDMFDIKFDFPSRAHCIARWYGLKEFFILSPTNPNDEINTESRVKLLLSSLSISLTNTSCHIPGFVQIQQRWRRLFVGTCISHGFTSDFEMAMFRNTPPQFSHLSGLLDIFREKLAVAPRFIPPIMASIRFTYILNFPNDEWVQHPPDFSTCFGSEVGYLNLLRQPFGPLQDPVSELHLATTWPFLSEEIFVDHAEYTDLDPIEAPKWSLRARATDNCTPLLYDHLLAFIKICQKSESTAQIIRSLSRDQIDIDSYGDITKALNRLTENISYANDTQRPENKPKYREQIKLEESPLPEDLLNQILLHLFPDSHEDLCQAEERQKILAEEQSHIEDDSKKDKFRKIKSSPEKSLLYLLTICLSIVNYSYGGEKKEHHEESLKTLKNKSFDGCIDANMTTVAKDHSESVDFEIESESDNDEFFEAVEEQIISSSLKSTDDLERSNNESSSGSLMELQERRGILRESNLKLLKTGQVLCIPITQESPIMTEDMLEEHTEVLLKLARSEGGSKYLAQMQSLSLFSDIQAFKAANPGCIFEDFVRWYSPNDWIQGPETEEETKELRKIQIDHQQAKRKADLQEIVGDNEIDEWNLEDDVLAEEHRDSSDSQLEIKQPQEEGHLSVRMRIPGNIWMESWHTALPVHAKKQKRLFDYTKEAEKVLHFLTNLKPSEIATLLFPVFIHTAINRILLEEESSNCHISNILNKIILDTSGLAISNKSEVPKFLNIARQLQVGELAISRIQFIEQQFTKLASLSDCKDLNQSSKDFISKLLSKSEVEIEDGSRGEIGRIIQSLVENNPISKEETKEKLTFPSPAGRDATFVCVFTLVKSLIDVANQC
eukprot:gene17421-19165_t